MADTTVKYTITVILWQKASLVCNNIITTDFSLGFPKLRVKISYALNDTQCVWEFQNVYCGILLTKSYCFDQLSWTQGHCHVFTWVWETYLAWYQQAVITGREIRAGRSLSHRWVVFCIVLHMVQSAMIAYIWCAMHYRLPSCFCRHWTSLQWWPVWSQLPKSI